MIKLDWICCSLEGGGVRCKSMLPAFLSKENQDYNKKKAKLYGVSKKAECMEVMALKKAKKTLFPAVGL